MKPINFKGANRTLQPPAGMENCAPLPVQVLNGIVMSCWELSEAEARELFITRKIFLLVWSGETQPPVALETQNFWNDESKINQQ